MPNPLPPLSDLPRLLVVKTSSIGDVIHALPVVQAIKEAAPALTLGWVVRRRCADILRGNPFIDHLYVLPDKPSLRELLSLRRELQAARYDIALDMQGLALSGLVTRSFRCAGACRLGPEPGSECTVSDPSSCARQSEADA